MPGDTGAEVVQVLESLDETQDKRRMETVMAVGAMILYGTDYPPSLERM